MTIPAVLVSFLLTAGAAAAGDAELGERIYRHGVLPSGAPVLATTLGDVTLEGAAASCASCHRPSGQGSIEGAAYVPPVTAPALFEARRPLRQDLFRKLYQEAVPSHLYARLRDARPRPAYDDASLGVALRDGIDPEGRALEPLMPRYLFEDRDLAHLAAYLRNLGAVDDPGVDEHEIRFATVVTPDAGAEETRAVLEVIDAYVARKNLDTEGQRLRPGHSPWHMDDFYGALRRWSLEVWRLEGAAETWPAQLEARYRERPVFALASGIGGPWAPIQTFCERFEVPCLFPNTDLPAPGPPGDHTLYLSRGLVGEAEALALYRRDAADEPAPAVVLWLGRDELEGLEASALEGFERVYASYRLLGGTEDRPLPAALEAVRERLRLTYPYRLPEQPAPRAYRVRGWLRSRGLGPAGDVMHERLRLDTFFALSVLDHALMHLVERFSRDYLIEAIEHETENALSPGVYPRLSLGPGQRFASKGAYLVRLEDDGTPVPVSGWVVP